MFNLFKLTFLLFFLSCVPGQESEVTVEGQSSIVNQVKVSSDTRKNIGDWSLDTDPLDITVRVKNNSSKPITKMNVSLVRKGQIDGITYKSDEGLSVYPGLGGTCSSRLASGDECTIILEMAPNESGRLHFQVKIDYKNLIGDETQAIEYKALAGTPASLVFSNDQALYDLGIVEQVDDEPGINRFPIVTTLVLQNKGELSARQVETSMQSTNDEPTAFTVTRNNCPAELKFEETCEIDVSYSPFNQDINDPETVYQSSMSIRYGKDQNLRPATLTSIFKSLSTKIIGRFERSGSQSICFKPDGEENCGAIVAGNSGTSQFKVINRGYQDAILNKIVISYKDMLAHCEVGSGENLLCYEAGKILKYSTPDDHWYLNGGDSSVEFDQTGYTCHEVDPEITTHCVLDTINKVALSLYDFPFLVQDTDLCMTNRTRVSGRDILNLGSESCELSLKFHPPINFNKEGQVATGEEIQEMPPAGTPAIEISTIYDSLWKDKVDTYIENSPTFFKANPVSKSQAILRVSRFSFGVNSKNYVLESGTLQPGDVEVDYNETIFDHDVGRYSMVLDSSIALTARIVIKNTGNTRAIINSIYVKHDGQNVQIPFKDGDVNLGDINRVDLGCAPSSEPFFRNVKSYCNQDELTGITWLDPDSTCEIRFSFTPVAEPNKMNQNLCMFGIPITDERYDASCDAAPESCNKITDADKREFYINYSDGTTVEDDLLTLTSTKEIQFNFDASLTASGKLQMGPIDSFGNTNFSLKSLTLPDSLPGFYEYGHIEIMNVGSNSVPYLYLNEDANLDPADYVFPEFLGLSFVESNLHPWILDQNIKNSNNQSYKDCYYLIQNKPQDQLFGQFANLFPVPDEAGEDSDFINAMDTYQGNPATLVSSLGIGESCILTVRSKLPYGLKDETVFNAVSYEEYTTSPNLQVIDEYLGSFLFSHQNCDGTLEGIRPDLKPKNFPASEIELYYFDNDIDTSLGQTPDNPFYGNLNYIYQNTDTFDIDGSEGDLSYVYPGLSGYPINAIMWAPDKIFPGIDASPLFFRPPQIMNSIFYFGSSSYPSGTYYNSGISQNHLNNTKADVEALPGVGNFEDYDQVISLGAYKNHNNEDYSISWRFFKDEVGDLDSLVYNPIYSEGSDGHKIAANLNPAVNTQTFTISPATDGSGYHVGEIIYTYSSNYKVEASRLGDPCTNYLGDITKNGDSDTNYVMLDIDDTGKFDFVQVTKRILVYARLYDVPDTPHISISTVDYEVCQDPATKVISEDDPYDTGDDANCTAAAAGGETTHPTYLYGMANSNSDTVYDNRKQMEDIKSDDLYSKTRIRIQNTGTQNLTFGSINVSGSATQVVPSSGEGFFTNGENEYTNRDYGINNSGAPNHVPALSACSGTLAPGESCAMFVVLRANLGLSGPTNRWLTVQYRLDGNNTVAIEKMPFQFVPLEPAQINIEGFGTPISTINDPSDDVNFQVRANITSRFRDENYGQDWEQGKTVDAIRLPMGSIKVEQAPTRFQFHLKLTADSGDLSAFIKQDLFNVNLEGTDWNSGDFNKTNSITGNSRINIDYDAFSPIYPAEPTCQDFHDGNTPMNDGESCVIVINYYIDETFINANSSDNVNGHDGLFIDYCNNYQGSDPDGCSSDRIYFTVTGDIIFADARTQSGTDLTFSNIEADNSGLAYFEWGEILANSNWSAGVVDYIIRYGNTEKTLSALEAESDGSISQRWVRLRGLVPGTYYEVKVFPVVDSLFSAETYQVEYLQGDQQVKFLVPDDDVIYYHDQELLVKVIDNEDNYVTIADECDDPIKVGPSNQSMQVMTNTEYLLLRSMNVNYINALDAYWVSNTDTVDNLPAGEVECLFPDPALASNDDFADAPVQLMVGDSEEAGYKNEDSHANCNEDILWIPEFFTGSSIVARGVCTYQGLDL